MQVYDAATGRPVREDSRGASNSLSVDRFLRQELQKRPSLGLTGRAPGAPAKRARLPSYKAGNVPSMSGVNIGYQDGIVDMQSNTTASLPLMCRPYAHRYEKHYTPYTPLFVCASEVARLHTIADIPTMNYFLRKRHYSKDGQCLSNMQPEKEEADGGKLDAVKAAVAVVSGADAATLGAEIKNNQANGFIRSLVTQQSISGETKNFEPLGPLILDAGEQAKYLGDTAPYSGSTGAITKYTKPTSDDVSGIMSAWHFHGVLRGEIGAGSLQKLLNVDVFGRSRIYNIFGQVHVGDVVGLELVKKRVKEIMHLEPNGASAGDLNLQQTAFGFKGDGYVMQWEGAINSKAKTFIPIGVVSNAVGVERDRPNHRMRAHLCSHDMTTLPTIEILMM